MNLWHTSEEKLGWIFPASWDFRKLFQLAFGILSALIASQLIIRLSPIQIVSLTVGSFLLFISVRKPEIGIFVIIVIIASIIFESSLPLLPIPGGSFHVTDIFLLFFLLMIPFKLLTDRNFQFRRTPLDLPLLIFYVAALISAGISMFIQGLAFSTVMRSFRDVTYYLLYYVVTNFIRDKRQIRVLFSGLFGIAAFVSFAMIAQAVVGESVQLMPGRVEAAQTFDQIFDATRILPPGQILVLVMFISALCTIAFIHRPLLKSGYFYYLFLVGSAVLLTYTRHFWVSIIFSASIFLFLISRKERRRVLAWLITAIILAVLFILPFMSAGGKSKAYFDSISERFNSMFSIKKTYMSSSIEWRKIENEYAWKSISQNPLFGIGLSNKYRPQINWMDYRKDWDATSYIHNGYLWILVDMGLLGFLPLMWFFVRFLVRGFLNWRKIKDSMEKSAVLGCTLSVVALFLSIIVSPRLMECSSIVVIATITGLSETIIQRNKKESCEIGR